MDFIPGLSMQKADPHDFSQHIRQNIVKSLIQFASSVFARDIFLSDLHPRNIMLTYSGDETPRLVFLDFGDARFGRLGYYSHLRDRVSSWFPGEYISPLLRWHKVHRHAYYYRDWIDWKWQPWLETEFADTEATIKPGMREKYLPAFLFKAMDLPDYSVDWDSQNISRCISVFVFLLYTEHGVYLGAMLDLHDMYGVYRAILLSFSVYNDVISHIRVLFHQEIWVVFPAPSDSYRPRP